MNSSDKKKVLALPFYLSKRHQLPEPRRGQAEFNLFKELTGHDWYDFSEVVLDREKKITEFEYENFLSPEFLKTTDTNSQDFKQLIRALNIFSSTKYERL